MAWRESDTYRAEVQEARDSGIPAGADLPGILLLVIKCRWEDAKHEARKRGVEIIAWKPASNGYETLATCEEKYTEKLVHWFVEERDPTKPFPEGTLLFYSGGPWPKGAPC